MSERVRRALGDEQKDLQWDLYSQKSSETEFLIRANEVENVRSPIFSEGFALRVIRPLGDGQSGIGIAPGSSLQNDRDVEQAFRLADAGSKLTSFPQYEIAAASTKGYPSVKILDPKIESDADALTKDLTEQVLSLLSREKDIRLTFCKVRLTTIITRLENCLGLDLEKKETFCYFEAGISPREGPLSEYWPRILARRIEDLKLAENIPEWTGYARDSSRAVAPETGTYDLIVPPRVLAEMAPPVVSFQASAAALKKGYSRWKERGQKVWSEKVTISDDGLLDYGLGTSSFDDEGSPQQKTDLISKGELRTYISNRMYAKFVASESTGNALKGGRRGGALCYNREVSLDQTNTVMEGGDSSREEMIKETKRGLLITQFSWMVPDDVTGSFGSEIRLAYLVENGEINNPVKGGVVNGTFFDTENEKGVFNSLNLISKGVKMAGSSMLPWVRFPEIRVSGS